MNGEMKNTWTGKRRGCGIF